MRIPLTLSLSPGLSASGGRRKEAPSPIPLPVGERIKERG